jgi:starch synthase (maltosyl-transferring)
MLFIVNLDPYNRQNGWVKVPRDKMGIADGKPMRMRDLVTGNSYMWSQEWNFIELDPNHVPYHIFHIDF